MFIPRHNNTGAVAPFEQVPCGAITVKVGTALALVSGVLALAAGANKPVYIAMTDKTCQAGETIPCIRVDSGTVYETTASAAMTSIKVGDKVTLSTDGEQVTATTTSGVAEIVYMEDTAAGSTVLVRF